VLEEGGLHEDGRRRIVIPRTRPCWKIFVFGVYSETKGELRI
jgi:hypothetical protein